MINAQKLKSSLSIKSIKDWLVSGIINSIGEMGAEFSSYSDLNSPITERVFSTDDNKLGTMIHIKGLRSYALRNEYLEILDSLSAELASYLRDQKHVLSFSYTIDPDRSKVKRKLLELYAPAFKTMKDTEMDLADIYMSNINKLAGNYMVLTDLVLCVWTIPVGKVTSPNYLFPVEDKKSATGEYSDSVLDAHLNIVNKIPNLLNLQNVDANVINIKKALAGIRSRANPVYSEEWEPSVSLLDHMPWSKLGDDEIREVPPRLKFQVTPGFCEVPSFDKLHINDRIMVKTLDISRFSRQPKEFDDLLDKLSSAKIPARLTYTITGGGEFQSKFKMNKFRSAVASKSDELSSINNLKKFIDNDGVVVGIQMTASTWVDVEEGIATAETDLSRKKEINRHLNRNFEKLESCITSWGGTETTTKIDTPLYAWSRNNAGFNSNSSASMSFAPLHDAIRMLPLHKMSPIWTDYATRVFRTPKKEIIPFNRMAKNQLYSFIIMLGAPRSGKSVLLGAMTTSLANYPGIKELPYISIIDVGRTSFGTLDMMSEALPEYKKGEIRKFIMLNDAKNAVNPFHLPMGLRRPIQSKKDNLVSFLKLLVCDENENLANGVEGYLSALVDEVYKRLDDKEDNTNPKLYGRGISRRLDSWLDDINYNVERNKTTYWELFDYFFKNGDYKKAHFCQAYASPLLSDFISAAKSPEFKEMEDENDHQMKETVASILRELNNSLRLYPILSNVSTLNLDEVRVLAIELGNVATTGAGASKQVAIMYSIALELGVRNFFITEESLKEIPDDYYNFHKNKYEKTKSLPKGLYMDEYHRVSNGNSEKPISKLVSKQILDYVRVASKEMIEFILSTHMIDDITPELLEMSSTQMILSTKELGKDKIIEKFGIDQSYRNVMDRLGNPTENGSLMLLQNETRDGKYTHLVYNTVAAEEIWGQVSYKTDVLLRDGLYKKYPKAVARKALATLFPGCSAKSAATEYANGEIGDASDEEHLDIVDRLIIEGSKVADGLMKNLAK